MQNFATHIGTIASTTRASVSGFSFSLVLSSSWVPSFSVAHLLNCSFALCIVPRPLSESVSFSLVPLAPGPLSLSLSPSLHLPLYIFSTSFFFLSIRGASCPPSPSHLSTDVTLFMWSPLFLVPSRSISLPPLPSRPSHPSFPADSSPCFFRILLS